MKCPHCNKLIKDERLECAFGNAENYGSNFFHLDCLKCKKIYAFHISRLTRLDVKLETSDQEYSDF